MNFVIIYEYCEWWIMIDRESRSHCMDLETAYAQGCKKLDQSMQVNTKHLYMLNWIVQVKVLIIVSVNLHFISNLNFNNCKRF